MPRRSTRSPTTWRCAARSSRPTPSSRRRPGGPRGSSRHRREPVRSARSVQALAAQLRRQRERPGSAAESLAGRTRPARDRRWAWTMPNSPGCRTARLVATAARPARGHGRPRRRRSACSRGRAATGRTRSTQAHLASAELTGRRPARAAHGRSSTTSRPGRLDDQDPAPPSSPGCGRPPAAKSSRSRWRSRCGSGPGRAGADDGRTRTAPPSGADRPVRSGAVARGFDPRPGNRRAQSYRAVDSCAPPASLPGTSRPLVENICEAADANPEAEFEITWRIVTR